MIVLRLYPIGIISMELYVPHLQAAGLLDIVSMD